MPLCPFLIAGDISVTSGMTKSNLNGPSPQFTLTCISTGGPATTVTWTRDYTTVTEGTGTVLNNAVTAQYTHTLNATATGDYRCTVSNTAFSASATITVEGTLCENTLFCFSATILQLPHLPVM